MVLPWPKRVERREIHICHVTRLVGPTQALNINAHMVRTYFGDDGAVDAVLSDAEHAQHAVEEPDRTGGVEPVVVEVIAPLEDDVVPAADDDEGGEEDVQDEEGFIGEAAKVEVAKDKHGAGEDGGDDAPEPAGLLGLDRVAACAFVCQQQSDAMDDGLDVEDAGKPAVQEEVDRVGPVGNPEEEVVVAEEEDEER